MEYIITVTGISETGEQYEEDVTVVADSYTKATKIALANVAKKFNNTWQFYVDWETRKYH